MRAWKEHITSMCIILPFNGKKLFSNFRLSFCIFGGRGRANSLIIVINISRIGVIASWGAIFGCKITAVRVPGFPDFMCPIFPQYWPTLCLCPQEIPSCLYMTCRLDVLTLYYRVWDFSVKIAVLSQKIDSF